MWAALPKKVVKGRLAGTAHGQNLGGGRTSPCAHFVPNLQQQDVIILHHLVSDKGHRTKNWEAGIATQVYVIPRDLVLNEPPPTLPPDILQV